MGTKRNDIVKIKIHDLSIQGKYVIHYNLEMYLFIFSLVQGKFWLQRKKMLLSIKIRFFVVSLLNSFKWYWVRLLSFSSYNSWSFLVFETAHNKWFSKLFQRLLKGLNSAWSRSGAAIYRVCMKFLSGVYITEKGETVIMWCKNTPYGKMSSFRIVWVARFNESFDLERNK